MAQPVTKRHAVEQANAEKPARKDFFHYLLNAQDIECGLQRPSRKVSD